MVASNKVENHSHDPKEYHPPQLTDLIDKAKTKIRTNYKRQNPARLTLISLLENLANNLDKIVIDTDNHPNLAEIKDIYLGAWIYCIESISNEYKILHPSYKGGYIFDSGSTLYNILLSHLGIDKNHQMTEKNKLFYLCKFYHFLFLSTYPSEMFIPHAELPHIRDQLIIIMRSILMGEHEEQERLLKAIPSEQCIDQGMNELYQKYVDTSKNQNPKRMILANLASAMSKHTMDAHATKDGESSHIIPRSARIKIGMLIYIMETIKHTYPLRSPENSMLYRLCANIIGHSYTHLGNEVKLACLLALDLYLNNEKNRDFLEIEFNKHVSHPVYMDSIVRTISINLNKMIKDLVPNDNIIPCSKVTLTASAIGAMIAAAPGYGAGYTIGYGVSLTDHIGQRKRVISSSTGYALQIALGMSSCYYGYYAADIFMTAGVERLFAKIFETLAIIIGATGAGAISFVIYDLSFTTALALCKLCLHLNNTIPSDCIKESDLLFIKTLLELPPEVFSNMKKDTLRKITGLPVSTSCFGLLSHSSQPPVSKALPEQPAIAFKP